MSANLFDDEVEESGPVLDAAYTRKIKTPIYAPKNECPHALALFDDTKTRKLVQEIEISGLLPWEKQFLIAGAQRHTVINYAKVADYYAHASKEMQRLMENSALVIIDFDKAIEQGYTRLSSEISQQYEDEAPDAK